MRQALEVSTKEQLTRFETFQPRFSLCARDEFEVELRDTCLRDQIGVLGYSPLAKGFLTGKFRSEADVSGKVYADFLRPHLNPHSLRILDTLAIIAEEHATTSGAVALAWVMAQPGVTAAIAAVDTTEQLDEMLGAVDLRLSAAEIEALSTASARSLNPTAP